MKKRVKLLAEQIVYYSDNQVSWDTAVKEASDYFKRRGFAGLFYHRPSYSSIGKKLAYKCMGKRYC